MSVTIHWGREKGKYPCDSGSPSQPPVSLPGGWSAYYGPRIWDSEAVGTIVGLFFPATAAVAATKLETELEKQLVGLEAAVNTAVTEVQSTVCSMPVHDHNLKLTKLTSLLFV